VPGDTRIPYGQASQARQILNDAEDDLRDWKLSAAATEPNSEDDANAKYVTSNTSPVQSREQSLTATTSNGGGNRGKEVDRGETVDSAKATEAGN